MKFSVGDKVIVYGRYGKTISEIEKITPTGRAKVDGCYFDSRGHQIGGDTWSRKNIKIATDKEIEEIKKGAFISKVIRQMNDVRSLSYEDAVAISNILNK